MPSKKISHFKILQPFIPTKILSSLPFALISHWIFQSLFYVDPTERLFKLGIDFILTIFLTFLLYPLVNHLLFSILLAFMISHTINFLFNSQVWCVLKNFNIRKIKYEAFALYVNSLAQRVRKESSIRHMYIYGSTTLGTWTEGSDLDGRIVRNPGFFNGLRACWFLLKERTHSLIERFPVDIYVLDNTSSLVKMATDEKGIDLKYQDL